MTRNEMIAAVDTEISRLEQIRGLLAHTSSERFTAPNAAAPATNGNGRRKLSEEARRRIALGQKRRWAKQRREAVTA